MFMLSGCGAVLEHLAENEMTDRQLYDKYVCEGGELSPPTVLPRQDCKNNKSSRENYEDFQRYKIERDIYLKHD